MKQIDDSSSHFVYDRIKMGKVRRKFYRCVREAAKKVIFFSGRLTKREVKANPVRKKLEKKQRKM